MNDRRLNSIVAAAIGTLAFFFVSRMVRIHFWGDFPHLQSIHVLPHKEILFGFSLSRWWDLVLAPIIGWWAACVLSRKVAYDENLWDQKLGHGSVLSMGVGIYLIVLFRLARDGLEIDAHLPAVMAATVLIGVIGCTLLCRSASCLSRKVRYATANFIVSAMFSGLTFGLPYAVILVIPLGIMWCIARAVYYHYHFIPDNVYSTRVRVD